MPAVLVPACTRNSRDHHYGWRRSPSCRDLPGTDQLHDADIKDPYQGQQGHCLRVHSLSPWSLCSPRPSPSLQTLCLHWDVEMRFETRVPIFQVASTWIKPLVCTSAPASLVLAFKAAGSQTCMWLHCLKNNIQSPVEVRLAWVWFVGYVNVLQEMGSNLNIHLKCHMVSWVWYSYVTELHAYDFIIKDFVIKSGLYLCWTLC